VISVGWDIAFITSGLYTLLKDGVATSIRASDGSIRGQTVKVIDWDTKSPIKTGRQFLGTIMGDHSKTAINTMLNTGTVCGVSSNVFVDDLSPKVIESFTWLGPQGPALYRYDKALEVMKAMMKRRNVELTDAYKKMMENIFHQRDGGS